MTNQNNSGIRLPAVRPSLAVAGAALALAIWGQPQTGIAGDGRAVGPDLAIRSHSFRLTGDCRPRKPVIEITITIENRGAAPSPEVFGRPMIRVMSEGGVNWGNSARLAALAPGDQRTLTIPVFYFAGDPGHMTARASHPFVITLDPLGLVEETDETNNRSRSIHIPPPAGCA